jgi:hypothetical protein
VSSHVFTAAFLFWLGVARREGVDSLCVSCVEEVGSEISAAVSIRATLGLRLNPRWLFRCMLPLLWWVWPIWRLGLFRLLLCVTAFAALCAPYADFEVFLG